MTQSWKISFACPRELAQHLTGDVPALDALDNPPLLVATEPDEQKPEEWRIDAYVEEEPSEELIALLQALKPGLTRAEMDIGPVGDEDWVTLSQAGLDPIEAGRFFVYPSHHADLLPDGRIGIMIDAGQAFGTGQHQTTTGCLRMIDGLVDAGGIANVLDIGTGTAILALAAKKALRCPVVATDIDPVSIEVSALNIALNGEKTGDAPEAIMLDVADGPHSAVIAARAPYDLVTANILAGPLIEMAAGISALVAPGGKLILAGLLTTQADAVLAAYAPHGLHEVRRISLGDWPTLLLARD